MSAFGMHVLTASWVDASGMECSGEWNVYRPTSMTLQAWNRFLRRTILQRVGTMSCSWRVQRLSDFCVEQRARLVIDGDLVAEAAHIPPLCRTGLAG